MNPFCYIILTRHSRLMSKVLSGSANHHRGLLDHSTSGDKPLLKSDYQLTLIPNLGKDLWSPMSISITSDSGNHRMNYKDFHLADTREKKQSRAGLSGTASDTT